MTERTGELIDILVERLTKNEGQAKNGAMAIHAQHLMTELTNFRVKYEPAEKQE